MTTGLAGLHLIAALLFGAPEQVTFSETIAPIIYQNCVTCHRPGEAAPFSLISYEDVKKRGGMIAKVTQSRFMPPWHAVPGYGEFKDERQLTDAEIAAIGEWVKQDMPEGDPSKMPKLPQFPNEWSLGTPDLILEMAVGYDLPAAGPDIFRNFVIPTNLMEDRWIRAIEFRPSARKVVHHVLFAYDTGGAFRKIDGADGRPGFDGTMAPIGLVGLAGNSGFLGGWAVGATAATFPDRTALLLPKSSDFVLQTHFHLSGKEEVERSAVGIYFSDKAPDLNLFGVDMPSLFGFGAGINIPAGKRDYMIEDSLILPVAAEVFGVNAHAHYVAREMKATATLPDGKMQPLVWIKDWDFNWQDTYNYKIPIVLPKGTRIDVSLTYDNSADNPRNPNNPPKGVMWGEQTFDEMGSLYFTMVPVAKEEGPLLQRLLEERQRAAIQRGVQDGTLQRMTEQRARSRR